MATEEDHSINDDAEMAECDGDKVVTMMDVLQEQQDFEEDANAVLGASDDKNCTYSKGYVKRQALYACLTCCPEAKEDPSKRAGVCLACSLACHENHELVELYTKRNFRCDCGNPKFNSHPCQFTSTKTDFNDDNVYNQNFSGLYCVCEKPYPDPDATFEDDMIQCIVCEDWLHASHLDTTVPVSEQYAEMICKGCMEKNDFLKDYIEFAVNFDVGNIDIVNVNGADSLSNADSKLSNGDVDVSKPVDEETIAESDNSNKVSDIKDADESKNDNAENTIQKTTENSSEMDVDGETPRKQDECNVTDEKDVENKIDCSAEVNNKDKEAVETNTTENIENPANSDNDALVKDSDVSEEKPIDNADTSEPKTEVETSETPAKDVTENTENTSDPVMDAIDELLATPKEAKPVDEEESPDNKPEDKIEDSVSKLDGDDVTKQNETLTSDKDDNSTESEPKAAEIGTSSSEAEVNEENKVDDLVPVDESSKPVEAENDETVPEVSGSETAINECKRKHDESNDDVSSKKAKYSPDCLRPKGVKRKHKGATFWSSTFRQKLCTCGDCLSMYKDLNVLFLTDLEDTVFAYESLGKNNVDGSSQYEKGLQALSSLDRVQQINALTEYNKMRDKLLDFLKSFKERKEVVKEDDIKAFFAGMKPQREPDGVYFCR